jgi:hypothetical protein
MVLGNIGLKANTFSQQKVVGSRLHDHIHQIDCLVGHPRLAKSSRQP